MKNPEVKKKLGYVSDDMFFFHGYSLQDMRNFYKGLYEDWNDERFQVLVKDFGLHMKRKISTFSKGMQKQAAIILALSIMPDYLILDEPIDGLDPIMRLKAWKHIIDDVADRNTSVLVSSHNLREMEGYCDSMLSPKQAPPAIAATVRTVLPPTMWFIHRKMGVQAAKVPHEVPLLRSEASCRERV